MKDIQKFNDFNDGKLLMVFGNNLSMCSTYFKKFDDQSQEDKDFLNKNGGKVKLSYIGFAEEWSDYVDFDKSYAYIDSGKLYVAVYGLPDHLNKNSIQKYYEDTLKYYTKKGYGEFFETNPGCPICMIVKNEDGIEVVV